MENFIIVSRTENHILGALGHEIHLTRPILMDLLNKNKINSDYIVVTSSEDRFFLYDKIFKVLSYNNLKKINKKINVIDLTDNLTEYICSIFRKLNHEHKIKILDYNTLNYEHPIIQLNNMSFIDFTINNMYDEIISNNFVVIHRRFNDSLEEINELIKKIRQYSDYKIVIFGCNEKIENVFSTTNLQLYASLLNHKNCKIFISEWSGGGQLSQYCFNGLILYYFKNYPDQWNYVKNHKDFESKAKISNNLLAYWDFKSTTNCERQYYKNIEDLKMQIVEIITDLKSQIK